jgi:metallo-beta-lactamase class B
MRLPRLRSVLVAARPVLVLVLACLPAMHPSTAVAQLTDEWRERNRPVAPQRIAGNLYFVGTADLTAFLLTSPEGHVLLDGGLPETAPLIIESIERLGFRPDDVRVRINSHAHFDHAGGLAELKRRTGAVVAASALDAELMARGGRGDFALGDEAAYPAVTAERRLRDGDTVRVGGIALVAHLTPGHTRGCTTWTTTVRDGSRAHTVAFVCSLSVLSDYRLAENPSYPGILADYRRSIAVVRALPCEIMLAPHASLLHGFHDKLARIRATGAVTPLVDPAACRGYAERAERSLEAQLQAQRDGPGAGAS